MLSSSGLELTPSQKEAFKIYQEELLAWNQKYNLTSIIGPQEIEIKHFLDSLSLTKAFDFNKPALTVCDVGAGAGFPGIPLKIAFPNIDLVLIDSVDKKVRFMDHLIKQLQLKQAIAIHVRAEDYAAEKREYFAVVLARAVAELRVLVEYCLPLVKVGGVFIAQKGVEINEELQQSTKAIDLLGGRTKAVFPFELPGGAGRRNLVVIEKVKPTPRKYPRKAGMAKKEPL